MSDGLTEAERDTALSSVAAVRLALQAQPGDEEDTTEKLRVLVEDRDENQRIELMFRIADLAATLLEGWHKTMMMVVPFEHQDEVLSPEQLLDQFVHVLIEGIPDAG